MFKPMCGFPFNRQAIISREFDDNNRLKYENCNYLSAYDDPDETMQENEFIEYVYDEYDRCIQEIHAISRFPKIYDINGCKIDNAYNRNNLICITHEYNENNQRIRSTMAGGEDQFGKFNETIDYTYDSNGNQISKVSTFKYTEFYNK